VTKARLTSKGQVTIPKSVRERLGISQGDDIDFIEDRRGFRVEKRVSASPFRKYRGHLKHLAGHDPDMLVEQIRGR